MRLQVRYRVATHLSTKPRPDWFSYRVALLSLLRSVEQARDATGVQPEVVYVANHGVPEALQDIVSATGTVVPVSARSAPRSFRRLLDVVPATVEPDDLVWLAEDDYLYRPDAMTRFVQAAVALPHVDSFALYRPDNSAWHSRRRSQPDRSLPARRDEVDGVVWSTCTASNATFGTRGRALREDARLMQLCSLAGPGWDHALLCAVQGVPPYTWAHLASDLPSPSSRSDAVRAAAQPVLRGAVNLMALRRSRRPRVWSAVEQDLITHCELGYLSEGWDWAAEARSVQQGLS